jgi:hypothetical protein
VYRADDLTLGQPVALKFLPEELSQDASRLERFRAEARVSRQVSHPNVCRVHDIGEADGRLFLSMELVDGGDLASLLKRVGRLPADRGLQIARQLCAGLAAAHDRGVLHRDLKPANIMIDGDGKVRIADFGLAGLAGGFDGGEIRSGTPAYMAPESLGGKEVTQRSDIYALGLVLYELFTGVRAFEAKTINEYLGKHTSENPTSPSEIVGDLDPEIERVVMKCLAKDPEDRPESALRVSLMLPGGDPLAAALAAGETPSPELIAQAGDETAMTPGRAWLLFGATIALFLAGALMDQQRHVLHLTPMDRPPAVQLDRARETLESLGVSLPLRDVKSGLRPDFGLIRALQDGGVDEAERASLVDGVVDPVRFWLRASPAALVNRHVSGQVTPTRPPRDEPGEVAATFDAGGRLQFLEVVPRGRFDPGAAGGVDPSGWLDWSSLFSAVGANPEAFRSTDPSWTPPQHVDQLVAWSRVGERSEFDVTRIEAGVLGDSITYVRAVRGFEDRPAEEAVSGGGSTVSQTLNVVLILAVLAGGIILARRNTHLGRVDSRGAAKVATTIVGLHMAAWLFRADHAIGAGSEFNLFVLALGDALFSGGFVWLLYMALEPEVRRHWPERLISWERFLTRKWRDPLVGRHVLVGLALGSGLTAFLSLAGFLIWTSYPVESEVLTSGLSVIESSRLIIGTLLEQTAQAAFSGLFITVLVLLARLVLRRTWAAVVFASVVFVGLNAMQSDPWYINAGIVSVLLAGVMFGMLRFGVLTLVATILVLNLFQNVALTIATVGWYGFSAVLPLAAILVVTFSAFRAAMGSQEWLPLD